MAKSKLIYVDAAPNYWERIINAAGKKERGKTGYRYALVDQKGQLLVTGTTEQVSDQMAAEAYGIYQVVQWAKQNKFRCLKIRTDCLLLLENNLGNCSARDWWQLTQSFAQVNNLVCQYEWIAGADNLADRFSRRRTVRTSEFPWQTDLNSKYHYYWEGQVQPVVSHYQQNKKYYQKYNKAYYYQKVLANPNYNKENYLKKVNQVKETRVSSG